MIYLSKIFTFYLLLLVIRVLLTWVPKAANSKVGKMLAKVTDPYLNLFKFIPPIGMVDISPMVAIFVYQYATTTVISIIINLFA